MAFIALVCALYFALRPGVESQVDALRMNERGFTLLLLGGLALAVVAEWLGLHFILGAFAAGLLFTRRVVDPGRYEAVRQQMEGIAHAFLGPLFFVSIGLYFDPSALGTIPGFVALLIAIAVVTKLVGAGGAALFLGHERREALCIGVCMSARGVVELIIATIALNAGLFELPDPAPPIVAHLFSAVVIMAIVTTVIVPPILHLLLSRHSAD
jgi:Kef-type K+ transport system membrane component KefB